jgi:hypothetical protein
MTVRGKNSDIMEKSQGSENLRLWISYPWVNREERDFAYLVGQLREAGIEATYDSLELLPDARLSERTMQRLLSIGFDGWLYILTHQCFTRKTCSEELTTAIEQTLQRMGPDFPMIGLLYGISIQHIPPIFRAKPCVSLSDGDWIQQISSACRHHIPDDRRKKGIEATRFEWKIHYGYANDPSLTAIEVRPRDREESLQYWRFAIPKSARPVRWGQGPSGGYKMSQVRFAEASGSGRYGNKQVIWFGASNIITNTESAYAVFSNPLPDFICFGSAASPFGSPANMEVYWISLCRNPVHTSSVETVIKR